MYRLGSIYIFERSISIVIKVRDLPDIKIIKSIINRVKNRNLFVTWISKKVYISLKKP